MKFLESSGERYDRWIRLLTFGRLEKLQRRMAERIRPGDRVLDIGCGSGTFCLLAARRGAFVKGIDISAGLLAAAQEKLTAAGLTGNALLEEKGVTELDSEPENAYDWAAASLVFSELSPEEQTFALRLIFRLLRPGGRFLFLDEVPPAAFLVRVAAAPFRFILQGLTFLFTGGISKPVRGVPQKFAAAGFELERLENHNAGTLAFAICRKPEEKGHD